MFSTYVFHVQATFIPRICFLLLAGADYDMIEPEGMEKFCEDVGVEPENVLYIAAADIIPREAKGYSFGLVGLSVRPSVTLFFLILCAYRLRDYATHNHETYTI